MSLRPLYGHSAIRDRLARAFHTGHLPASLLFQGARGVGKQQLGLWLGRLLLCERAVPEALLEPCGECQHCRYNMLGQHPDLHWFFPRPKIKEGSIDADDIKADLAEAIADRVKADGLYEAPAGNEGIFIDTVKALVKQASVRPAMARRSVFVVGDADRMVSQVGSDQAANVFLKLLEEPPPDATIILTSSEAGALLPTIRSRVVTVRVAPLGTADMTKFVDDVTVVRKLTAIKLTADQALARASGAPGAIFNFKHAGEANANAADILKAALMHGGPQGHAERLKVAARQGAAGARGKFTDMLDALTALLHQRARVLALAGDGRAARRTAHAIVHVEFVKEKAAGNVSPNLLTASLVTTLHELLTQ